MPTLRKALVLGVGSTGLEICKQLAERLTWTYGSLEEAKWIRILVMETQYGDTTLGNRMIHTGISPEEYAPYLNNSTVQGSDFDFGKWQDRGLLSSIHNASAGAGNIRMLGRLTLFHRPNFNRLQVAIQRETSLLDRLNVNDVAGLFQNDRVDFDPAGTHTYVVGTLCGGTCSGGCVDLGYLLSLWGLANREAIFTIPHPRTEGARGERLKKNAYFALKELNHFMLPINVWKQKIPGRTEPQERRERPYGITRIIIPTAATLDAISRSNNDIAQYLALATGPACAAIAGGQVNELLEADQQIGFMRPYFSTMGIATLEYPGEHIMRALTDRLQAETFVRWVRHTPSEEDIRLVRKQVGLASDFDALLYEIAGNVDGSRIDGLAALQEEILKPETPDTVAAREKLRQLATPFTMMPALLRPIESSRSSLMEETRKRVRLLVSQSLFSLEGGPQYVRMILQSFSKDLNQWSANLDLRMESASMDFQQTRKDVENSLKALDEKHEKFKAKQAELAQAQAKRFPFRREQEISKHTTDHDKLQQDVKADRRKIADQIQRFVQESVHAGLLEYLRKDRTVSRLQKEYDEFIRPILTRLDVVTQAFQECALVYDAAWKERAKASPKVNGKVFFEEASGIDLATGTIHEEYFTLLRQIRGNDMPPEEIAGNAILESLRDSLLPEIVERSEGMSALDPKEVERRMVELLPDEALRAADRTAGSYFRKIRTQRHIAAIATEQVIDDVVEDSEPKLVVRDVQIAEHMALAQAKRPGEVKIAYMDVNGGGAATVAQIQAGMDTVNAHILLTAPIADSRDPFRLVILQERHGFTFGQMRQVVRVNQADPDALQSAEGCADFSYWHTRRDVTWIDPLVTSDQLEIVEENLLMALLLGHKSEAALTAAPTTRGVISDPRGWYDLQNRDFFFYYVDNMVTLTEGEPLPRDFDAAVARLLQPTTAMTQMRFILESRIHSFVDRIDRGDMPAAPSSGYGSTDRALSNASAVAPPKSGADILVESLMQAIEYLHLYHIEKMTRERAIRMPNGILPRAFRRNSLWSIAFFRWTTKNLTDPSTVARLVGKRGMPMRTNPDAVYSADGYYCGNDHHLGSTLEGLLDKQLICPYCLPGDISRNFYP